MVPVADWCLQSDYLPGSHLQGCTRSTTSGPTSRGDLGSGLGCIDLDHPPHPQFRACSAAPHRPKPAPTRNSAPFLAGQPYKTGLHQNRPPERKSNTRARALACAPAGRGCECLRVTNKGCLSLYDPLRSTSPPKGGRLRPPILTCSSQASASRRRGHARGLPWRLLGVGDPCCVLCSTWEWPCLSGADWCLHSNVTGCGCAVTLRLCCD